MDIIYGKVMLHKVNYAAYWIFFIMTAIFAGCQSSDVNEHQLTNNPDGHILTNIGAWSSDSQWLVYDVRREESVFDGTTIERVNVNTKEVDILYESTDGAYCGVVTYSPVEDKVVFIHGPENPTDDWQYAGNRRRGVIIDVEHPGVAVNLDARDITTPFTTGALRGGTHVHVFSGDGKWVSFTYQDVVLERFTDPGPDHDMDLRNIGVSVPVKAVAVKKDHPRNHDGSMFTVLVTSTTAKPIPGSDQICRAFSDAWVGTNGYIKANGALQKRAIAFQGHVKDQAGQTHSEVYIVDIPEDVTVAGEGPLEGTEKRMPFPPKGTSQRRLTYTLDRKYPGLQGPRHWLRSSPDGSAIAFLMKDDDGIVQIWTVSPNGGEPVQITKNAESVSTAFSWSPDGKYITYGMGGAVYITDTYSNQTQRVSPVNFEHPVLPHAVVYSPDGNSIAYLRKVPHESRRKYKQIFVINL